MSDLATSDYSAALRCPKLGLDAQEKNEKLRSRTKPPTASTLGWRGSMEIVSLCSGRDAGALRADEDWHAPDARKAHPAPGLRDARGALSRVIEAEIIPRLALA